MTATILVSIAIVLTLVGVMAPAKGNDALAYHLSYAKYFAEHHAVTFIPYTSRSIWPFFMQMFFTLALLFKSILLAKCFHFSMALFCGLAVYSFCRRYINSRVGFYATATFILTPGVFTQATYAYIDLGWTLYTFLGFYALLLWDSTGKRRWLLMSAVLSGIAAGTKHLGLLTPFILCIMLLVIGGLRKRKGLGVNFGLFCSTVFVVILPYYIRPYILTGNPFYPLYVKYIGENGWQVIRGFGMEKGLLNLIISPWALTYYPGRIFAGGESQLSPIYLAFLPALALIKKGDSSIKAVMMFSGLFYICWFFVFPAARFTLPLVPFLAVLVGFVIYSIYTTDKELGNFAKGTFIFFLLINLAFCFYYNREELSFFMTGADSEAYLAKHDRASRISQYISKQTPPASKILVAGEIRVFYLGREHIREDHYRIYDKYHLKKIPDIISDLKDKGVTHICYAERQNALLTDTLALGTDNRISLLLRRKGFVDRYLEELATISYDDDFSQKTKYTLYSLK